MSETTPQQLPAELAPASGLASTPAPPPSQSLSELFSLDPLQLTSSDVAQICLELRKQRETWLQEESLVKAAGKGRVSTTIASKPKVKPGKLTDSELASLGLGNLLATLKPGAKP